MPRRPYDLPSLTTLAAFEAAARHLSFKEASGELNVTPGAVSHQIKALESDLGVALFDRQHRGVALTEAGARLAQVLARGFGDVSSVVRQVRAAGVDAPVTVATTTAVSSLWLTPRITQFWRDHGEIAVNQTLSDTRVSASVACDLHIHYGRFDAPDLDQTELFRDTLVPLCHRDLVAGAIDLPALAQMRLIHLDTANADWTTWREWFVEQGYDGPVARGIRVNNYSIALQAAQDGAGVVLGWARLVAPLTKTGALMAMTDHAIPAPRGFHISHRSGEAIHPRAKMLKDWLLRHI